MEADALIGGFDVPAQDAAQAFRRIMDAMARPGQVHDLVGARAPAPLSQAAATVLLTLADPDTPIHLAGDADTADVRQWIGFHSGASLVAPSEAMFAVGAWCDLQPIKRFSIGTAQYPDRSATLIVELPELRNGGAKLAGPGIREEASLSLPEIAPFQANSALFPQGCDFIFTSGARMAALPRSTQVS